MPPKRSRKRSHGGGPPSSTERETAASPMPVVPDPAFDFLTKIPSPVVFPPSQSGHTSTSGVATSSAQAVTAAALPSDQSAALLTPTAAGESPFDFLHKVPSPVNFASSRADRASVTVRISPVRYAMTLTFSILIHRHFPLTYHCSKMTMMWNVFQYLIHHPM